MITDEVESPWMLKEKRVLHIPPEIVDPWILHQWQCFMSHLIIRLECF